MPTVARPQVRSLSSAAAGTVVVAVVMAAAMLVPAVTGWSVHSLSFPPIQADWAPRVGPGSLPAIALAALAVRYAACVSARWPWPRLLVTAFGFGAAWLVSLATVDGWAGVGHVLDTEWEYLPAARDVTDVGVALREYVSRIPLAAPDNWPVHVAGHPPGALLFFVLLVRLGLGGGLAAGWVILLVAATTPVAVLLTVRRLGAEPLARAAAPFLVVGPAAIWLAVSADAMFAAVGAWGLCALAYAATAPTRRAGAGWAVLAGLLLGYCVLLSYGLPLLGLPALAILVAARSRRPLPWAVGAAAAVVLAFAAAGFAWWTAYPVLVERYWDGVASQRPAGYWIWANLAALAFSAGPLVGAAVATAVSRLRAAWSGTGGGRTVVLLTVSAALAVVLADLSGMSRAEVERIWLPFVPWLLVATALLSARWRRYGFAVQVGFALVAQHLLATSW